MVFWETGFIEGKYIAFWYECFIFIFRKNVRDLSQLSLTEVVSGFMVILMRSYASILCFCPHFRIQYCFSRNFNARIFYFSPEVFSWCLGFHGSLSYFGFSDWKEPHVSCLSQVSYVHV